MRYIYLFVALIMSTVIVGCATIVSGTTEQVTFQSSPDGALVKVNGKPLGRTPITIRLDRVTGQTLTIEKQDYNTFSTIMDTSVEPWFFGNIIIGGLLGSTTDAMSGAMYNYSQGQYFITLQPTDAVYPGLNSDLSKADDIRSFLYKNYKELKDALAIGEGEVINATFEKLAIQEENKSTVYKEMQKDMQMHLNPDDFVDLQIKKYIH